MTLIDKLILTIPILVAIVLVIAMITYSYVTDTLDKLNWELHVWGFIKVIVGVLIAVECMLLILQIWIN